MKAKHIIYSRTISRGNYENTKIEVCIEVEKGEKASQVFLRAKEFVRERCRVEQISEYSINKAKRVLEIGIDKYTPEEMEDAQKTLNSTEIDDLPF